ncbi:hypothetical protein M011DRAFT_90089 [Sporormia fimetaria CBS 119925]|uniref:Uncharacterized protein n=1 Tax=Sporormia fimetaria CBS 119925 TaxID=1340428 RepID=A0A6A6VAS3_9PLEO|nr:hypothetical protein M011DRAFT_90089 [Sporormia fimetaria CBS 119925]
MVRNGSAESMLRCLVGTVGLLIDNPARGTSSPLPYYEAMYKLQRSFQIHKLHLVKLRIERLIVHEKLPIVTLLSAILPQTL